MWLALSLPVPCRSTILNNIDHGDGPKWWDISVQMKQPYTASQQWGNAWTLGKMSRADMLPAGFYHCNHCTVFQHFGSCLLPFVSFLKAGNVLLISGLSLPSLIPGREKVLCSHLMNKWACNGYNGRSPAIRVSSSKVPFHCHMCCLIWNAFCQDNGPWGADEESLCQFLRWILLSSALLPLRRELPFLKLSQAIKRHFPTKVISYPWGQQTFSIKGYVVNILSFVNHMVSDTTTQLCCLSMKTALDTM